MSRKNSAAIFDLDRTLISGSSSTVFMQHLTEAGVADLGSNPLIEPLVELAQFTLKAVYDIAGESRLLMQPAKLAVRASVGWDIGDVEAACAAASKEIVEMVQPFARPLIEEHRAEGRLLGVEEAGLSLAEALGCAEASGWGPETPALRSSAGLIVNN